MNAKMLLAAGIGLSTVFAHGGCQSSPAASADLVTMPQAPTGQCRSLGELVGHAENAEDVGDLPLQASRDLKRQALARGATHLQLSAAGAGSTAAQAHGVAFRCEGAVSYPGGSMLGPSDPRAALSERARSESTPLGPAVPKRPPTASLGSKQEQSGCLRGHAYPVRSDGALPEHYEETEPTSELWGCDWNIAAAPGALAFANAQPGQSYAVRHQGAFSAPSIGIYIFQIDGSQPFRLTVGDQVVLSGQGQKSAEVKLAAGEQAIKLEYLYTGGKAFDFGVQVKPPGGVMQPFSVAQGSPFYAAQGIRYEGAARLGEGWRELVDVQKDAIHITKQVHFETDRLEIRTDDQSQEVLFAVAKAMRENPGIKRLEIQGHTDDQGDARYNQELSQRRAESVRKWLVNAGVEPHRLVAKGYGKTKPLGGTHSIDQRAENRRVQFVVLTSAAGSAEAEKPVTADARP